LRAAESAPRMLRAPRPKPGQRVPPTLLNETELVSAPSAARDVARRAERVEPASVSRSDRAALLALLVAVALARMLAVLSYPIYDDAFITYRYASNLGSGHGLVFAPGAEWEPLLGTTTPGYAVLLGLPAALGLDLVGSSIAFNIACDVVSAAMIFLLLRSRPLAAALAVAAFAALPQLARISVGGMEAPLFAALALGAALAGRRGRLGLAGWVAALDCTVRPEGVLLVAVLAILHVRTFKDLARFALPVAAVGAVAIVALTAYYGTPIPQSVRAKADAHGLGPRSARAFDVVREFLAPASLLRWASPLVILGVVAAYVRRHAVRGFVGFGLAMVMAYAAAGAKTWGWYFYVPWIAWCVGLALGIDALVALVRGRGAEPLRGGAFPLPLSFLAIAAAGVLAWRRPDRVTELVYEPMRDWSRAEQLARPGVRLFASDIGAIGYLSGATILDAEGLVWPEGKGVDHQMEVVRAHSPEYVMCVVNGPRLGTFLRDPSSQGYVPIQRFNTTGADDLTPDPELLPKHWVQDYLFFRRADVPEPSR
jgi:hypothetical protein